MNASLKKLTLAALALGLVASLSLDVIAGCGGGGYGGGHYYRPYYNAYRPAYRPVCAKPVVPVVQREVVVHQPVAPAPAPVPAASALQIFDLRFVDPGHPGKVGPRFRVFIRNRGTAPNLPFDLVLAGGIDRNFNPSLPQAAEHVSQLAPGQVVTIDIRMPIESMAMQYPGEERPAPFSILHVLMSGEQDLLGNAKLRPVGQLPRIGIQPVDIALVKPANPVAPAGAVITLRGEGFGVIAGQAALALPGTKLAVEIANWGPLAVQLKLPELNLVAPTVAKLLILRNDGATATMEIKLVPAPQAGVAVTEQVSVTQQVPANPAIEAQPVGNPAPTQGPGILQAPQQGQPQPNFGQPQGGPQQGFPQQAAPQQPQPQQPQPQPQQQQQPGLGINLPPGTGINQPTSGNGFGF